MPVRSASLVVGVTAAEDRDGLVVSRTTHAVVPWGHVVAEQDEADPDVASRSRRAAAVFPLESRALVAADSS